LSEVRNGRCEQLRLLPLGRTKNKFGETFDYVPHQGHDIDSLLPLDVLLN
jgi:hypothetical protein